MEHAPLDRRHRPTGITWNIILLFVSLCFVILCIETGMRVCNTVVPSPHNYVGEYGNRLSRKFIPDERVGWRMRPNRSFQWTTEDVTVTYTSDDDGFRTCEDRIIPTEPARRIAILGDSYMWGSGVPCRETCGLLLESADTNTVVYNMAMPGFALDQIWLSLRNWALPRKPDLVVVGIFPADLIRSLYAYRLGEGFNKPTFRLEEGRLVRLTRNDRPSRLFVFLENHSFVYRSLWRIDWWIGRTYGRGRQWTLNRAFIDAIREDCEAAGIPVIFIHIPYPNGISFPALDKYMEEHSALYIDLSHMTPSQRNEFYFPIDRHLNAKGHAHMAQLLIPLLPITHPSK